jgi:hypothetical protein
MLVSRDSFNVFEMGSGLLFAMGHVHLLNEGPLRLVNNLVWFP